MLGLGLLLALAAAASVPCPEPVRAPGAVHAAPRGGDRSLHAAHGASMPCHEESVAPELRATCGCGCGERPSAAGVPTGFGLALPTGKPAALEPQQAVRWTALQPLLPQGPPRPIDHVPLPFS